MTEVGGKESAADEKEGGRTISPNTLVTADVVLAKETTVIDLHAPEEAFVAKAKGTLAVDLQHRRSGRKRKTIVSVYDEAASKKNAAVMLAEEATVVPVDNAVTQTLVAVSGDRSFRVKATRDSALASEALPLVAEDVALQQLTFNKSHTRWITPSNPKWMEIKPVIKTQLDNEGFTYGKTNNICAFLRRSLNDGTLSPDVIQELDDINFEWSPLVAQSKKDEYRALPTTTNAMCLEMGLRPLEKQKLKPWTRAEDLILEAQVEECGEGNWSEMNVPGRTRTEIQSRFRSSHRWTSSSESDNNRLTDEESTRLRELIHALPNGVLSRIPWKTIAAEHFTDWTPEKLKKQWERISRNELKTETLSLAAVPSATVASATVMAAVAKATVAPVAVMAAVASQLTVAAYMTAFGANESRTISIDTSHKVDKASRQAVGAALKSAEIHRLVVINVPQLQMILRGEQLFPIEPTPSMYKNTYGQNHAQLPMMTSMSQPPALVPVIPVIPVQPLAIRALSPAIPALVPAMPSLSLAMPAVPPVVGLDGWSFSPDAMPMLDYDENDINVETVAEENEMEFEFVAI